MADVQITAPGVVAAPLDYLVPGSQEIIVKAAFATFDGTASASAFLPCLRVVSPGGKVVGEYVTDTSVAAGASADVSFFPRGKGGSSMTPLDLPVCYAFLGGATGNPWQWASVTTNDPTLFYIDGSDNTKLRIASAGTYLVQWNKIAPQATINTPFRSFITLFDNFDNAIQGGMVIDQETGGSLANAPILSLFGQFVFTTNGATDAPFYLHLDTAPVAQPTPGFGTIIKLASTVLV